LIRPLSVQPARRTCYSACNVLPRPRSTSKPGLLPRPPRHHRAARAPRRFSPQRRGADKPVSVRAVIKQPRPLDSARAGPPAVSCSQQPPGQGASSAFRLRASCGGGAGFVPVAAQGGFGLQPPPGPAAGSRRQQDRMRFPGFADLRGSDSNGVRQRRPRFLAVARNVLLRLVVACWAVGGSRIPPRR
jgi:hypothetical protein